MQRVLALRPNALLASRKTIPHAVCKRSFTSKPVSLMQHNYNITRIYAQDDDDDDEDDDEDFDEDYEDEFDYEEEDDSIRLYLDTADVAQWEKWAETGLFYGFTTNPSILKKDGVQCTLPSMRTLTRQAFDLGAEELQLQVWGRTVPELYSCGLDLQELDSRVVVKVPATLDGFKAARRLIDDGVPVTITGVYAAHQIVSALAVGASYAAPYLGRMNDAGKNGLEEIIKMQSIVHLTPGIDGLSLRLLVASIRDAEEIAELAAEGCNTFTFSPAVAEQLVNDPLTNQVAATFQQAAEEMGSNK